jgi:8-oxo-dGTP diphosphatase
MSVDQNIKVAVDAVVFGYDKKGLSLLLIERKNPEGKNKWALPGGFVEDNENLLSAAKRELKEETNLSLEYLKQFHTFGEVDRDPRGRIISVAHLVLINKGKRNVKSGDDAKNVKWFPFSMLPKLAFDHDEIVQMATDILRQKIASLTTDCVEDVPNSAEIKLLSVQLKEE